MDRLEHAEPAAREPERDHRRPVDHAAGHRRAADPGMHLLGHAHEPPGERELVVPVVEHDRPAAATLGVEPPSLRAARDVPAMARVAEHALDPNRQRLADRPFIQQRLRLLHRRVEHEVLEHLEEATVMLGRHRPSPARRRGRSPSASAPRRPCPPRARPASPAHAGGAAAGSRPDRPRCRPGGQSSSVNTRAEGTPQAAALPAASSGA